MSPTFLIWRRRTALVLLLSAALAPATAEAQRAEGSFQRTLTVGGRAEIDVVSGSGRIEVRPGSDGRIEISARIQASNNWWRGTLSAEERVRRIEANPPVEQSGTVVRIGHIADEDLRNGLSISYTLTVPSSSSLTSKTGSGSQELTGVAGRVESSSGSGSLTFRDLGGDLRASAGSGSIVADAVRGAFHATTGSGSIRASGVGGRITARTGSGSIEVEQTGSGGLDVGSGSGSVRARGVRGDVKASTSSGSLDVQGQPAGEWRLSSSSGSVTISLPSGQGFEVDASTSSGRIRTDFPVTVTGDVDRRSLRGSAQGGGPLLHVRTSSGGISIQRT